MRHGGCLGKKWPSVHAACSPSSCGQSRQLPAWGGSTSSASLLFHVSLLVLGSPWDLSPSHAPAVSEEGAVLGARSQRGFPQTVLVGLLC